MQSLALFTCLDKIIVMRLHRIPYCMESYGAVVRYSSCLKTSTCALVLCACGEQGDEPRCKVRDTGIFGLRFAAKRAASSASLSFWSEQSNVHPDAMKRKHDALVDAQVRRDTSAAQPSLAQAKTGQYLPGQDLLTESVFWSARRVTPNAKPYTLTPSLACRVKHLGSKGWGLIAKQHVRQGSVVLEYVGEHDCCAWLSAIMICM